jgi:1-deoxy-D-xylulose-5-phosphate synthase
VGEDGPTHHGALDCSFLRAIPGALIMAPRCANELRDMMYTALSYSGGPVFIRYPRGSGPDTALSSEFSQVPLYQPETVRSGAVCAVVSAGDAFGGAEKACDILEKEGLKPTLVNARFIKPLDTKFYADLFSKHEAIITVESSTLAGGFGSAIAELALTVSKSPKRILRLGYPDTFLPHGSNAEILKGIGLDAEGIAKSIRDFLKK